MIIQGGYIIGEEGNSASDIRVDDGIIIEIRRNIVPNIGEEIEDAKGCMVVPGGIDVHTHFDMPAAECNTADDFCTGSKAAIAGGTTTIVDFAEPDMGCPLQQGLDMWHKKADYKTFCDYGFHMTVSTWNQTMEAQMKCMVEQGVTSFKAYTAYKGSLGVEEKELEEIMRAAKKLGAMVCVHCEDDDILQALQQKLQKEYPDSIESHPLSRPNIVEQLAVKQVIRLAEKLQSPVYIVHLSTREGLKIIKESKAKYDFIYAETCPHYLLLDESKYYLTGFESAKYVMSPPLRSVKDQVVLWEGLRGHLIDTVSTDHCAFFYKEQKSLGIHNFTRIPNGIPSVEQRMELMYHYGERKGVSFEDIAKVTATNPAKIFGMYPQKGVIKVGSDADIVIMKKVAPYQITQEKQYQHVDYTPYEGVTVSQKIQTVYLRGMKVVDKGMVVAEKPTGQFLKRS